MARAAAGGGRAGGRHPDVVRRLADGPGLGLPAAAARNWDSSIFAPLYTLGSLLGRSGPGRAGDDGANRLLRGRGFFSEAQYNNLGRFMVGAGPGLVLLPVLRLSDGLVRACARRMGHPESRTATFPVLVGLMVVGCFGAPVFGNMIPALRKTPWVALHDQRLGPGRPRRAAVSGHRADVRAQYGTVPLLPTGPALVVFFGIAAMFVLTYLLARALLPDHVLVGDEQGADAHGGAEDGQRDGDGDGGRPAALGDVEETTRHEHSGTRT